MIADPSAERRRHDRITRAVATVPDAHGGIGHPWLTETPLERMQRRGDIGAPERAAGDEFARLFRIANLDPLRAADLLRANGSSLSANGIEHARRRLDAALHVLGGAASPCGSCAWFVLGVELSLAQWAQREGWQGRPLRHEVAKGTLIGTLGVLRQHFGT